MAYPLFSFTSTPQQQDQSSQAGIQQYLSQGAQQINPGQSQVAQSNPIAAAARYGLGQAFQGANQGPQAFLPQQQAQQAMAQGAQANPNVAGQNMGGVGPTNQNDLLARALMQQQGGT